MHGTGKYTYPNGDKYEGEWVEDHKEGFGVLVRSNGTKYEGYWLNDKEHGTGTLVYAENDRYNGEWNMGKKHGTGEIIYINGDRFKESFSTRGSITIFTSPTRRGASSNYLSLKSRGTPGDRGEGSDGGGDDVTSSGIPGSDLRELEGEVNRRADGRMDLKWSCECSIFYYEYNDNIGTWTDDHANGYGVYEYSNGNRYEGEWLMDKRHGVGMFYCKLDGSTYNGGFVDGKKEGYGTLALGCGNVIHGIWHRGTLTSIDNFEVSPNSAWSNPDL